MAAKVSPAIAVMAINPEFADRILAGTKRVEFRRTIPKRVVSHVLIYSTAPCKVVVGYFEVTGIDIGAPADIWKRFGQSGGVSAEVFWSYYRGSEKAVAIKVGRVVAFKSPLPLGELSPNLSPPQSFCYLSGEPARKLRLKLNPHQDAG